MKKGTLPFFSNVSANYKINKDVKIFMNGCSLSDKKYIASRIEGIHPGQGFQMMAALSGASDLNFLLQIQPNIRCCGNKKSPCEA